MVDRFAHNWKSDSDGWPKSYMEPYDDGAYVRYTDYVALQQQLAAAREALQAADADAARYRHMRDNAMRKALDSRPDWFVAQVDMTEFANHFDMDIDAALATLQRDRQP